MEMKFYKCQKCGKVFAMLKGSACPTMCCDQAMVELKAGTTDAAVEKHVPVITVNNDNTIDITVGSVIHPMEEKHFIEWIALQTKNGIQFCQLKPGQEPKAKFALLPGDYEEVAFAYCNLHGLWASK